MRKRTLIFILFIFVIFGVGFGLTAKHFLVADTTKKQDIVAHVVAVTPTPSTVTKTETKQPNNIDPNMPQTLDIPAINVEIPIESVGLDQEKRMDVPKNANDAGWYDLGVKPGEAGSSVIDGHLDKVSGAPAAFWNLHKLNVGDKIIVTNGNGKKFTFSVIRKTAYNYDTFPIAEVFGPSDKKLLNLISCTGTWDSTTHNYSERTVIYSQLDE